MLCARFSIKHWLKRQVQYFLQFVSFAAPHCCSRPFSLKYWKKMSRSCFALLLRNNFGVLPGENIEDRARFSRRNEEFRRQKQLTQPEQSGIVSPEPRVRGFCRRLTRIQGCRMKTKIVSGACIAISAVALALSSASPAAAKHKHHNKPKAEKSSCSGKSSCASKGKEGKGADMKTPGDAKPADAK
jgi:hypothetical protein